MMLKTKYPQADNVLSALLADVEKNEKDSDVADLVQDDKIEKLTIENLTIFTMLGRKNFFSYFAKTCVKG